MRRAYGLHLALVQKGCHRRAEEVAVGDDARPIGDLPLVAKGHEPAGEVAYDLRLQQRLSAVPADVQSPYVVMFQQRLCKVDEVVLNAFVHFAVACGFVAIGAGKIALQRRTDREPERLGAAALQAHAVAQVGVLVVVNDKALLYQSLYRRAIAFVQLEVVVVVPGEDAQA